jgi:hypothetical protein
VPRRGEGPSGRSGVSSVRAAFRTRSNIPIAWNVLSFIPVRVRSRRFACSCRSASLSCFGGVATIVSASDYVSTFRGAGVEPDLVAVPVGLRFYVRGDECRSATSLPCPRRTTNLRLSTTTFGARPRLVVVVVGSRRLGSDAADEALGVGVRLRGPDPCVDHLDPFAAEHLSSFRHRFGQDPPTRALDAIHECSLSQRLE